MTRLVWFRTDLRSCDHPALSHACRDQEHAVIAVVYRTQEQWQQHGLGSRRINLMTSAMVQLQQRLAQLNIPLLIRETDNFTKQTDDLMTLCQQLEVDELDFNIEYEINERHRDIEISKLCQQHNISVNKFHDQCMLEPGSVTTQQGDPYRVYSPFRKAWTKLMNERISAPFPAPTPRNLQLEKDLSAYSVKLRVDDDPLWSVDEEQAHGALQAFLDEKGHSYEEDRNIPSIEGTSRLSMLIALGILSARQCVYSAWHSNHNQLIGGSPGLDGWINELIWREFYRHLIVAYPDLCKHKAFKPETESVAWRYDQADFDAWCEGRTGYPIVDAAMKQLNETGWMHNRLRMISAMFLTKHLLIDWRWGEKYFNQMLVDADFASNNGGWQWSASTGEDGAPYFRIFNPTSQSQKFDKDGVFICRYLPKLAGLSSKARHEPSVVERQQCGYELPVVEHKFGRQRALDAFKASQTKNSN